MFLLLFACAASDKVASHLSVGTTAPDFTLIDQDNQEIHLSDYQGQVVLMESAAEW